MGFVDLTPWTFFQTGTTTNAWNPYEICAYSGVYFGNGVTELTEKDFITFEPKIKH